MEWSHFLRICAYFTAITGCFCIYSLIQERLMTVGFGPKEEVFQYSVFIVLVNRLVTCAVSAAALAWLDAPLQPAAPLGLFAVPSVANVVGSTAQYEALKYVSFPLQALAKCAKSVRPLHQPRAGTPARRSCLPASRRLPSPALRCSSL
jgi:adenosine 3'-phospho 5'-phosphosulfate transporter B2